MEISPTSKRRDIFFATYMWLPIFWRRLFSRCLIIQGGLAKQGNQRQRQQVGQQEHQVDAEGHTPGSATLSL